jgi:formate dehydrogenase maturation protein FdhE
MNGSSVACPFCGSPDVELVSAWGGQLITSQLRCRACNTHFEAVREDFEPAESDAEWRPARNS